MERPFNEAPTGLAQTDLPFLSKLDDAAFEEFCAALLDLHPKVLCQRGDKLVERQIIGATKLLSGTSQRGVDIRADVEGGEVWCFQFKRVQAFGPKKIERAIELAEKGFPHADQFVLVITCGLSATSLEAIKRHPRWDCWSTSRLTTETLRLRPRENAINLVHRFFGPDAKKALFSCSDQPLLSWQEFFAQDLSDERRHFNHKTPFVPLGNTLSQLEDFARSGAGKALILSAAGGHGKSRLLLQLAQRLKMEPRAPRVRFLNLNRQGLSAEQRDFLVGEDENLLLVVDDAHRLDAAIEDVARMASKAETVRLLVATRPQALASVERQLYENGYAEKLEKTLRLPRWKPDEILALAEQVLGSPHRQSAVRLAKLADRCPLLVVLGGALIASGHWPESMTGGDAFRERVFRSFKEDSLRRQSESKRERLDRLIQLLSFVSPAPKNEALWKSFAEILICSPLDVAQDLESLDTAGLAVENSEGVRLYPDLFADAVLLDACLDRKGRPSFLDREVLSKIAIDNFPALMRNVAQADWEARAQKGRSCSLFDPIWSEFIRRFEDGTWLDHYRNIDQWILDRYAEGASNVGRPGRNELIRQWASFAIYLPEQTLELAELALKSVEPEAFPQGTTLELQTDARNCVCEELPPLLKPIVIWHPKFATRALDILWSLDVGEAKGSRSDNANAIAAIAEAARFELHKPQRTPETVIEWLECKVREPAAIERIHRQPGILSALLKPFFGREIEQGEVIGRTFHISTSILSAEKTRSLRQRALAIAERFICSDERDMVLALLPMLREALHSIFPRFGEKPTPEVQEAWLPDRLEVLKVLERTLEAHRNSPFILIQLRPILLNRYRYDPCPTMREECHRVISRIPDSFEFRFARVLTSWTHEEILPDLDSASESQEKAAEDRWMSFCRGVANETAERFKTAKELCEFVRHQVRELEVIGTTGLGGTLLDLAAERSSDWCNALIEELLAAEDTALDRFLWPVLHRAETAAPEAYRRAVESLPISGRPEQLSTLISYLGRKHSDGGSLDHTEWKAILDSTHRTEESVVFALASIAGRDFRNVPRRAIEVLRQLKPAGGSDADAILCTLAQLAEIETMNLQTADVAQCLANVGERCFDESTSGGRNLERIAERFPKQVYEQIRDLHERAATDPARLHRRPFADTLALGPINDPDYVNREIDGLWRSALSAQPASFSRQCCLALIRSLLLSEGAAGQDRHKKLAAECESGDELKLAAELVAVPRSRFVFAFPDRVRALLVRGEKFGVTSEIHELLWSSACGGGRSFTGDDLNPEYRYILEQGESLANRYRDDAHLGAFYRSIANSERRQLGAHKRTFHEYADLN